jgi:hypothetical protein
MMAHTYHHFVPFGKHRRPSRGGLSLTPEQLAMISVISMLFAAFSAMADGIGIFGGPAPIVVTALPAPTVIVTITEGTPGSLLADRIATKGDLAVLGSQFQSLSHQISMSVISNIR